MKNLKWLFVLCILLLAVGMSNPPIAAYAQGVPRDFAEGMRRIDAESHRYLVKVYVVMDPTKPLESMGTGSGELVRSADGVVRILTNAHVVGSAATVMVQFDKERFAQEVAVLGVDTLVDLALLEAPRPLPATARPIAIAKRPVAVGDVVYAAGYPGGNRSISYGAVTSLSSGQGSRDLMFSHQAPIGPGSSGGALIRFTDTGAEELVGINSQVYVLGGQLVSNIGLSIKSRVVERLMAKLEGEHSVTHAFIGVGLSDADKVNPYLFRATGGTYPPAMSGIVVTHVVNGSPAARAGILPGDVIRKFEVFADGQWFEMPVRSAAELSETVFFDVAAGTQVRATTSRGTQEIGREFVLETYPTQKPPTPQN
ncbi:MAG: trypsin-like peptidase domain-containing protein [bacterium]|nr:trypsin-like peptidase domain-containing protein [bacterium]